MNEWSCPFCLQVLVKSAYLERLMTVVAVATAAAADQWMCCSWKLLVEGCGLILGPVTHYFFIVAIYAEQRVFSGVL